MKFLYKKAYLKAILGGILGVFVISGGVYFWYQARHFKTLTIKKTDIRTDIPAQGKIVAADSIDLGFETDGKISDIFAKQGDKVAFGGRLAQLDTVKLQAEIKQYRAKIELDKLKLSQFLSGAREEEVALAESKVDQAQTVMDNARKELDDLKLKADNDLSEQYALALDYADAVLLSADNAIKALAGIYSGQNKFLDIFVIPESQKKSEAEWQAMFARSALDNIKVVYESVKKDPSQKNVDQALAQFKINLQLIRSALQKTAEIFETAGMIFGAPDIGSFKTTVAVQRSNINSAQTAVLTMEQNIASAKINSQTLVNKAERDIELLEQALKTADDELALKKAAPRDIELSVYQAQIKESESYVEVLKNKLDNSIIKAPVDGIVGAVRKRVGAFVKMGEQVFSFVSFSDVEVEAKISASEAEHAKVGDTASVSLNGVDYEGRIISLAGDTARVYLQGNVGQALPGTAVDINIHSVSKSNVILVPKEFIFDEDGTKKVNLIENNAKKPVAVIVGREWSGQWEIEEGVSEGDVIAL